MLVGSHRPALREKIRGRWTTTSWGQWQDRSERVAAVLQAHAIKPNDRVVILAATQPSWVEVDLGVLISGAITVPIYPTLPADQASYIARVSGAVAAFVDDPLQAEKLLADREVAGRLRLLVLFSRRALRSAADPDAVGSVELDDLEAPPGCVVLSLDDVLASAAPYNPDAEHALKGTDLATIIFTSGTSGPPKGAMLSHSNFSSQVLALEKLMGLGPHDEQLLFLPLAHVFGRMLEIAQLAVGFSTSFAQSPWTVVDDARDVNPTFMGSVPRLYEKFQASTLQAVSRSGPVQRRVAMWALDVAQQVDVLKRSGKPVPFALSTQHKLAEDRVLRSIRERFGHRLRFVLSGGAPLSREVGEWFSAIGIRVLEGYGLTETTAQTHVNQPSKFKLGTVGPAVPGVEAQIASDGEVLVRGPNVMAGYWEDTESTREAIDEAGWFHTGDVGEIDPQGMLRITDRKKDIIITAGGKNIAPHNVEDVLRQSPWIADAVVYGDRKPYLVALISLPVSQLEQWARERGRVDSPTMLTRDPEIKAIIQREILAINKRLASYETIKRFVILDHELGVEAGELTPTLKVKRKVLHQRYREQLDELYHATWQAEAWADLG